MSTNTGNTPEDIADMVDTENKIMSAFVAFILGVLVGFGIGYLVFVRFPWTF